MIRFKVDNSGKGLTPLKLRWWKPTSEEWAPKLLEDQKPFWKRQVDPTYQRPWSALSPRYRAMKAYFYPGQPILRATGEMQDSASLVPVGKKILAYTTPYGAFHQFGTKRMPARPWIGLPDKSMTTLADIALKNILPRKR